MLNAQAEIEVAAAVVKNAEVARELDGVIQPGHFGNPSIGWIVEFAIGLWRKYGTPPTEGQLLSEIAGSPLSDLLRASAQSFLPSVLMATVPPVAWVVEETRKHAAERAAQILANEIPMMAGTGDFAGIVSRARGAAMLAAPSGELTRGMGTSYMTRHQAQFNATPTGVLRLDQYLGGGLQDGRLGHVLGKKGGGKSHTLAAFSSHALSLPANLEVFYCTLEMPGEEVRARHERNLMNMLDHELPQMLPAQEQRLREYMDRLTILDATRRPLTVAGLIAAIERADRQPNILFVDYAGIFAECGGGSEADRRTAMGKAAQELHMFAQTRHIPVWTAYQANRLGMSVIRRSMNADVLDATHYAVSIEPAWHADVIVSVNQNDAEAGSGTGRLHVAENRGGPSQRVIECLFDWSKSRITDLLAANGQTAVASSVTTP